MSRKGWKLALVLLYGALAGAGEAWAQWTQTTPLPVRRSDHTATLLSSGKVLVAGGAISNAVDLFDPVTHTWESTAPLNALRSGHTATLLPSGHVLVVGRTDAEVYDPVNEVWEETGPLNVSRNLHTATLLDSGKVLLVSGAGLPELYDPVTRQWSLVRWESGEPAPSLSFMRHTATRLPTRLLATGFVEEVLVAVGRSVEIYEHHLETDTWNLRPAAPLLLDRSGHTATLLPSGEVLIAGGGGFDTARTAEIYTLTGQTGSRLLTAHLGISRSGHTATLLPSGKVLVTGGEEISPLSVPGFDVFDPQTEAWSPATGSLPNEAKGQTATLLPDGSVLILGGFDHFSDDISPAVELNLALIYKERETRHWRAENLPSPIEFYTRIVPLSSGKALVLNQDATYLFDENSAVKWTRIADPQILRRDFTATLLVSGKILLTGGVDGSLPTGSAELFDPADNSWNPTGSLVTARSSHTATLLPSGKVLVAGGFGRSGFPSSTEIYDPNAVDPTTGTQGRWEPASPLGTPRVGHTATLLLSGKVLVTGGSSAEIYDPETRRWEPTGSLHDSRVRHTAVLLASGKVLAVGGDPPADRTAEVYDPATAIWTAIAPPLAFRGSHSATLLPDGRVLVAGGNHHDELATTSAEIYNPAQDLWEWTSGFSLRRKEHDAALLASGRVLVLGGLGVEPVWETGEIFDAPPLGADRQRPQITSVSPVRYGQPMTIQGNGFRGHSDSSSGGTQNSAADIPLVQLRGLDGRRLFWLASQQLAFSDTTLTLSGFPAGLDPGLYLLSVVVASVPSPAFLITVECGLVITRQPASESAAVLGQSVTFSVESEGGETYQWMKDGQVIPGATSASYTTPPLNAADSGAVYTVAVRSRCTEAVSAPAVVQLADSTPPQASVVSPSGGEYWLLSPADGGERNREVVTWSMSDDIRICRVAVQLLFSQDGGASYSPVVGGHLLTAGPGGVCRFGQQPTNTNLTYEVPTQTPGPPGALYKIQVEVTDQAGHITRTLSANPFFIVQSNPDSVRTLIVGNLSRMALSGGQRQRLARSLQDLAAHPRVQGVIIDLGNVSSLGDLYRAWDAAPADPQRANDVLLQAGGVRDYLRSQVFPTFTGARYIVLVGEDKVIPFARIPDSTGLPERAYVQGGDLTAGTTIGAALAGDFYLSDDLLAVRGAIALPLTEVQRERGAFLPDLPLGRLVESPDEIIAVIANFISQNGVLDLQAIPATGHKVQVTGYDFLLDSGRKIRDRWKEVLNVSPGSVATAPVDGTLLTPDWGASSVQGRIAELSSHLAGNGGAPYAIINLNGHATHHQEGVPGDSQGAIAGLSAEDFDFSLGGAVIYGVGCHGGLSVPGQNPLDHPLDLPQTYLSQGSLSYIANTGYGWGLVDGTGYSERLVELFTEEMTGGGTVIVGEAVRQAKLRYFLQLPRFDPYDEKTLLQWTVFGLPMYAVRTGIGSAPGTASAAEASRTGRFGKVTVEAGGKSGSTAAARRLPPSLTQLNVHFDFSAAGVYTKYDALGNQVEGAGCPAKAAHPGCYYTLNHVNGGGTGSSDLPILPYFVFDSRLSGTSQHGAFWVGGSYVEEADWVPLFAKLASNGGDFSHHGALPRAIQPRPRPRSRPTGSGNCRPDDLDLSSLVVVTGEVLRDGEGESATWRQRLYSTVDLEILYFNNQSQANCDREGPLLGAPPFGASYHRVSGSTVQWAVPASDEAGVWRVVVLYDTGPDSEGRGSWLPLDLTDDGTGVFRGTLDLTGSLTYFVQAVDRRGNVNWLEFTTADLPASGVQPDLPQPVEVVPGGTFSDVPAGFWAWAWIEALVEAGITGGCGNGAFCPDAAVDRAATAVFLVRASHGVGFTPPPATGTVFTDVQANHWAGSWIEQLAADAITGGCSPGLFCPGQALTRAQMAVLLLRARNGITFTPPPAGGTVFGDVPADHWAAAWIERLAAAGITGGCGGGNFCPDRPVTRAEMAVFLVRAFELPLP